MVENIRQFRDGIKTIVYSLPNSGMFYVADRLVDNYYYEEKYMLPKLGIRTGEEDDSRLCLQRSGDGFTGAENGQLIMHQVFRSSKGRGNSGGCRD